MTFTFFKDSTAHHFIFDGFLTARCPMSHWMDVLPNLQGYNVGPGIRSGFGMMALTFIHGQYSTSVKYQIFRAQLFKASLA